MCTHIHVHTPTHKIKERNLKSRFPQHIVCPKIQLQDWMQTNITNIYQNHQNQSPSPFKSIVLESTTFIVQTICPVTRFFFFYQIVEHFKLNYSNQSINQSLLPALKGGKLRVRARTLSAKSGLRHIQQNPTYLLQSDTHKQRKRHQQHSTDPCNPGQRRVLLLFPRLHGVLLLVDAGAPLSFHKSFSTAVTSGPGIPAGQNRRPAHPRKFPWTLHVFEKCRGKWQCPKKIFEFERTRHIIVCDFQSVGHQWGESGLFVPHIHKTLVEPARHCDKAKQPPTLHITQRGDIFGLSPLESQRPHFPRRLQCTVPHTKLNRHSTFTFTFTWHLCLYWNFQHPPSTFGSTRTDVVPLYFFLLFIDAKNGLYSGQKLYKETSTQHRDASTVIARNIDDHRIWYPWWGNEFVFADDTLSANFKEISSQSSLLMIHKTFLHHRMLLFSLPLSFSLFSLPLFLCFSSITKPTQRSSATSTTGKKWYQQLKVHT